MTYKNLIDEINRKIRTISDIANEVVGLVQDLENDTDTKEKDQERIINLENTVIMLSTLLEVAMIEFQSIFAKKKEANGTEKKDDFTDIDGRIFKVMDYYVQLRRSMNGIQLDDENIKAFKEVKKKLGFGD